MESKSKVGIQGREVGPSRLPPSMQTKYLVRMTYVMGGRTVEVERELKGVVEILASVEAGAICLHWIKLYDHA